MCPKFQKKQKNGHDESMNVPEVSEKTKERSR